MATKVKTGSGEFTLTDEEERLLNYGRKIEAIKSLRSRFDLGLREAKEIIDAVDGKGLPTVVWCPTCNGLGKVIESMRMTKPRSFHSDGRKKLFEYEIGERFSYIDDRLYDGAEHTRAEISKGLAEAMAHTAGYEGPLGNKAYVCCSTDEAYGKRTFVYFHDLSYYLYIVWPKR